MVEEVELVTPDQVTPSKSSRSIRRSITSATKRKIGQYPGHTSHLIQSNRRGNTQLWQFLRQLLDDQNQRKIITWTRKEHGEFKLIDPDEVAKL